MSENVNNANIRGVPLSAEELIELMGVDGDTIADIDIETAIDWWDKFASNLRWVGALEAPFDERTV